jgi:hypothetical protein
MKKKRLIYSAIGMMGIGALILIDATVFHTKDATSEIPPKPPPHSYIERIVQEAQPRLDPIISKEISKAVYKYSQKYEFPPELIIALMERESSIISTQTSSANCVGLMQINPKAHPEKVEGFTTHQLYHIDTNVRIGCQILREYYDNTQSIETALEKYLGAKNTAYINDVLKNFADKIIAKKFESGAFFCESAKKM